jgi:hypothetical protein
VTLDPGQSFLLRTVANGSGGSATVGIKAHSSAEGVYFAVPAGTTVTQTFKAEITFTNFEGSDNSPDLDCGSLSNSNIKVSIQGTIAGGFTGR